MAEHSNANPRIRRGQLIVRIAGIEQVAKQRGDVAEFYTITCPSRMHPQVVASGAENPRYDGTSSGVAHAYLNKLWQRARAKLYRSGAYVYGFRAAEPQHDETPHWHLLLFVAPEQVATLRNVLRDYALAEDGDELGATGHRFTEINIDHTKGTAAGYIAKYVAKYIDGAHLKPGEAGADPKALAQRVDAWAKVWGIR